MKSEDELYAKITDQWFEAEKKINEVFSGLAENNKKLYEQLFGNLDRLDDTQRALWEKVDFIDQLSIESNRDQAILVNSLRTLLAAWHEHQDHPAMIGASKRFLDHDISGIVKSMQTDKSMMTTIKT